MPIKTFVAIAFVALVAAAPISSQEATKQATTRTLECAVNDCPLLQGAPQTAGMRGGLVRLKPWQAVGWHTTGADEECLVILHGSGEAQVENRKPMPISSQMMVYIPPATRHNVQNTGRELLEYVYVVAPAAEK